MISPELEMGGRSTAQPESPSAAAIPEDMQARAPRRLAIGQIDERLAQWRLLNPRDLQRLQDLIHSEDRIRDPVLVSTAVEPGRWVLVDGFKRLQVAKEMHLTHLWVQAVQVDEAHAKAMMLQCNQPREGLSTLEEARIVRSLCIDHNMNQIDVAKLLKRSKSWVCRQMKLARNLDEVLLDYVSQGTLSATTACNLSRLQRCNQKPVAQAVIDHQLSSRESSELVRRLRNEAPKLEDKAVREMLEDPWRYIGAAENGAKQADDDSDSRLSENGNRLRRSLLRWQRACDRLTDELRRTSAADARVLAPLIQDAVVSGTRAVRQLEITQSSCSTHQPSTQGQPDFRSPAP